MRELLSVRSNKRRNKNSAHAFNPKQLAMSATIREEIEAFILRDVQKRMDAELRKEREYWNRVINGDGSNTRTIGILYTTGIPSCSLVAFKRCQKMIQYLNCQRMGAV